MLVRDLALPELAEHGRDKVSTISGCEGGM